MTFVRNILIGTVSGAAGTVALNVTTYLDMALRGRPSSDTPAKLVQNVASSAGIDSLAADDATAEHRRSGVGSLLGYANGLIVGAVYGATRSALRARIPVWFGAVVAGGAVMVISDVPAAKTGATDPKTWGTAGWLSDVIPHTAYGVALAGVFNALENNRSHGGD